MNILVIGNGFDLAHGLPTRYADFLKFCDKVITLKESKGALPSKSVFLQGVPYGLRVFFGTVHNIYNPNMLSKTDHKSYQVEKVYEYIKGNFWYIHFSIQFNYTDTQNNWIDFESEIGNIVRILSNIKENQMHNSASSLISKLYPNNISIDKFKNATITIKDFLKTLESDLDNFISALEIYLSDIVDKIKTFPIKDIKNLNVKQFDHVLSFNYTNTIRRIYEVDDNKILYIHGNANSYNTPETSKIVLGIDEYLPKKDKNKDLTFIFYKKYFQRIYKKTGNEYLNWIEDIKKSWKELTIEEKKIVQRNISVNNYPRNVTGDNMHQLYIFGHSLDITDRDVLRKLILNKNVKTNIFYYREYWDDRRNLKEKVANLVKIIGQDELIKRTGGSTRTIEFVPQSIPESKEVY